MPLPFKAAALLLPALLLLLPRRAEGLFQDQAGLNDFVLAHVGLVEHAVIDGGASVVVGTRQGVAAALHPTSGEVLWRVVLLSSEGPVTALCASEDVVGVVSGKNLRVFSREDGALQWDATTTCTEKCHCKVLKDGSVVAGSAKQLEVVSKGGKSLWILPLAVDALHVSEERSGAIAILSRSAADGSVVHSAVDAALGKVLKTTALGTSSTNEIGFASFDGKLVAKRSSSAQLTMVDLVANFSKNFPVDAAAHVHVAPEFVVVQTSARSIVLGSKGEAVLEVPGKAHKILGPYTAQASGHLVVDEHAVVFFYQTAGASFTWRRDESLSMVTQIVSTVMPIDLGEDKLFTDSLAMRYTALFAHLMHSFTSIASVANAQAKVWMDALSKAIKGEDWQLPSVQSTSDEERARFGLARVFVALTETGKVLALHSETSAVLWEMTPGYTKPVLVKASTDPPQVMILDSASPRAVYVAADTGKVLATTNSSCDHVLQSVVLPGRLKGNRIVLVLLCNDLSVRVLPDLPEARSLVSASSIYFYAVGAREVTGYALVRGSPSRAYEAWNVAFPSSSSIVRVAAMAPDEVIGSPARALGDQTVLIKYINRHWISVASIDPDSGLRVTSIDAVSGRTLHRLSHKDGALPVHAVRFENWLVVSYWNTKAKRVEISSTTLYERALSKRAVNPWTPMPKGLLDDFDSFEKATGGELIVFQRTFALSGQEVTALGVTLTRRGIAAKNLLIALGGTGQVLMMDQRFIDPRRTAQPPTPEETAEGLFQYAPELPIVPVNVLSYYRGAARVRLFHVAPAKLESTCHVVAVGLDLFKGRASPSGAFDLLAEDFSYSLLSLLLMGLGAAVVVLRRMERRKLISDAWF